MSASSARVSSQLRRQRESRGARTMRIGRTGPGAWVRRIASDRVVIESPSRLSPVLHDGLRASRTSGERALSNRAVVSTSGVLGSRRIDRLPTLDVPPARSYPARCLRMVAAMRADRSGSSPDDHAIHTMFHVKHRPGPPRAPSRRQDTPPAALNRADPGVSALDATVTAAMSAPAGRLTKLAMGRCVSRETVR